MKHDKTLTGKITQLRHGMTRYGYRAEATLECVNWADGEVTTETVVAWGQVAHDMVNIGIGGSLGASGYRPKPAADVKPRFNAKSVGKLRHIDPATIDLSKYL